AGDLGGHLPARHVARQQVREPAAERVVDAAGAAGDDREPALLRQREPRCGGRAREREHEGTTLHGRSVPFAKLAETMPALRWGEQGPWRRDSGGGMLG